MNNLNRSQRHDISKRGRQGPSGQARGRSMDLIASISRSSGLEDDGDALKDFKVQGEYRQFIQTKLDGFWKRYPRRASESTSESKQRVDIQENILILFRKLREGIVSSNRKDIFALEVYETSLYVAILFNSPRQTTPIFSHLIPDLYLTSPQQAQPNRLPTVLVSLLYHIISGYPSQSLFYQLLHSIPLSFLPRASAQRAWILSLASGLRSRNYVKVEELTRPTSFSNLIVQSSSVSIASQSGALAKEAISTLVDTLRHKSRETTWAVIRGAYRELSCHPESDTRDWLVRTLALPSVLPKGKDILLDDWLERKSGEGHVRPKEAANGRWIVCTKVR